MAYAQANDNYVAYAPEAFNYQGAAFPIVDFSFAMPMDLSKGDEPYQMVADAWYAVVEAVIEASKGNAPWASDQDNIYNRWPVNVTLHARFIKNSSAMISPAYQPPGSDNTHTCFIEFLSFAPPPEAPDIDNYKKYFQTWTDFCRDLGKKWMQIGGPNSRPHWAKDWQMLNDDGIYEHIRNSFQYGGSNNLDTFKNNVRDKLDPSNTFMNKYIELIFQT